MTNRPIAFAGILIFIFIAIIVTLSNILDQFLTNFLSDFLATLAGVAVGIPVALWYDRRREQSTRKPQLYKMLVLLGHELAYNYKLISAWRDTGTQDYWDSKIIAERLKDESWKAFSEGGEIEWIKDVVLLGIISDAYYEVRSFRELGRTHSEYMATNASFVRKGGGKAINAKLKEVGADALKASNIASEEIAKIVQELDYQLSTDLDSLS